MSRPWSWRWLSATGRETLLAGLAVVGAIAAVWITLRAQFLAHPGWLAVQKADFILGPIGVGLYWRVRRPGNRLGLLLIVLGLLGLVYLLQSTSAPGTFTLGTVTEYLIEPVTAACILAFPSGRLDGRAERLILGFAFIGFPLCGLLFVLVAPQYTPGLSLSGCRALCPANPLVIWPAARWGAQLTDAARATVITVNLATAGVLISRFVSGTPPQRRALAIGGPIALCFLLTLSLYQTLSLLDPSDAAANAQPLPGPIDWVGAASRSAIWYGFLVALIAAELFASRVLRDVVRRSLGHPPLRELEGLLRGPLGDPGLRLGFWDADSAAWLGNDGAVLGAPAPGQVSTMIDRSGRDAAVIIHDAQLSENPELLQAAGAAALLAQENTELHAAWQRSVSELAASRERLVSAAESERRKLERDLHDGAQQRLVAATINLTLAGEAETAHERNERIAQTRTELEEALIELREVAHGIYPTVLARSGLSRAFHRLADRYENHLTVSGATAVRFAPQIELALYYCGLEAVQNASKHAGPNTRMWLRLHVAADQLHLQVRDNGRGFDVSERHDGIGLQNMRDRIGAVGGQVDVISQTGQGTLVHATIPAHVAPAAGDT